MKRTLTVLILLISVLVPAFSYDARLNAMGDIGVAVSGLNMRSYVNPAAVFFDENSFNFALNGNLVDTFGVKPNPYLPGSCYSAMFAAEMVTISLSIDTFADNFRAATGNVDIYQTASIDVNFSAGYRFVSVGVGVSGGSTRQRIDCTMDTYLDAIEQSILAPYDRVVNSEFIQVNAGVMFKVSDVYAGILFDNVLQKDGAATSFNFESLFDETGVGLYYSRPEYSGRGRMNIFVYSFGAEVNNLFVNSSRSLNLGAELKFRLVRDSSVNARLGYSGVFSDADQRKITAGVGLTLKKFEFSLNGEFFFTGETALRLCATALL